MSAVLQEGSAIIAAPLEVRPAAPLAVVPQGSDSHALMAIISRAAVDPAFDIARLERLLVVKKEWEADEARKAFHAAKAEFKREPLSILKDSHVNYTKKDNSVVDYWHATLGAIVQTVTPALSAHGLSAAWSTDRRDGRIFVTCTLTHRLGHSEGVTLDGSPDESGGKNAIQAMASTVTYLQRYTLMAVLGLGTIDGDDDGRGGRDTDSQQPAGRGAEPPPAEPYPAADFEKNLPAWREAILAGKTTAAAVIAKVQTKAPLTKQQQARIHGQ